MNKKLFLIFQIAAVFIGTIVGAGLASGQEITQFFTTYGYKSFFGILICCIMYIFIGYMIIDISTQYGFNSYNEFILKVSPGPLGRATDILTGVFLLCSSAIILAGSGALLHQYFGISKWFGIILMALSSFIVLLRNTQGLVEINSFIVPSLILVILTIFILYILFSKDTLSLSHIKSIPSCKSCWLFSSLLYGGFNILCCSGVLVPLSNETKDRRNMFYGLVLGAVALTALCFIINLLLLLNIPYIFKYEIPLLYISNRFGIVIQIMLLCIIWLEMFSTEVSDIYSISKTMEHICRISYKRCTVLILLIAIPISQIGFVKLINILYPAFGVVSLIFVLRCTIFYRKLKMQKKS